MKKSTSLVLVALLVGIGCVDPTSVVVEPLRVINWTPTSGAFCVDVGATVSATFSDEVDVEDATSENFYLLDSDGLVSATVTYDPTTFTIGLQPGAPLGFDRLYTTVAAEGLRSRNQGRLAIDLDASFRTIARHGCAPGVECVLPSDCPGNQICANIGVCIDECVTNKDCYRGECLPGGTCSPGTTGDDGPPGGDPLDGDTGSGD